MKDIRHGVAGIRNQFPPKPSKNRVKHSVRELVSCVRSVSRSRRASSACRFRVRGCAFGLHVWANYMCAVNKTRGKGPADGGHTRTEKRSTRRSTQTDAPGPAVATPTWTQHGTPLHPCCSIVDSGMHPGDCLWQLGTASVHPGCACCTQHLASSQRSSWGAGFSQTHQPLATSRMIGVRCATRQPPPSWPAPAAQPLQRGYRKLWTPLAGPPTGRKRRRTTHAELYSTTRGQAHSCRPRRSVSSARRCSGGSRLRLQWGRVLN